MADQEASRWEPARWRVWQFLKEVYREYVRDHCSLMAAAISFYVLLSFIPLLLVGVSGFGYVLDSETAFQAVSQFLDQFAPREFGGALLGDYLAEHRGHLKEHVLRQHGLVGILGFLGWIWAASRGFSTITLALNIAWGTDKQRGFVATRLSAIGMMLVVGVLLLLSLGITSAMRIIQEYRLPWLGFQAGEIPWVWGVVGWALPSALSMLIFVLCYLALPERRIGWRAALAGGVAAGVLWEMAKQGFALYIANFGHYNKVYGSLGGLILLMMWAHYSAAILLLGGEVAKVSARRFAARHERARRRARK